MKIEVGIVKNVDGMKFGKFEKKTQNPDIVHHSMGGSPGELSEELVT